MFTEHTEQSAPEASANLLQGVSNKMGFVPTLYSYIAESPTAIKAYNELNTLLADSSLTPQQVQVALLATSVENQCRFCVAAHSAGSTMAKVEPGIIEAVRTGTTPSDGTFAALVTFTQTLVRERGWASDADVNAFLNAGFSKAAVFDVITAVALKTLSNYSNHLTQPALNPELESFAWAPPSAT
ncbi:carboxymuconolactone decarboxylase family protein [Saccharospirillum impatiens]|uniref:carboxymuconolactone decarboxylase family protein n=1 Tax=Saccharospirillum impatiens TaxID=169438 RepID=UPI00040A8D45|nr:carboxymuconolactone decarboxylase family protein [Saccharospirillum impatiens]